MVTSGPQDCTAKERGLGLPKAGKTGRWPRSAGLGPTIGIKLWRLVSGQSSTAGLFLPGTLRMARLEGGDQHPHAWDLTLLVT